MLFIKISSEPLDFSRCSCYNIMVKLGIEYVLPGFNNIIPIMLLTDSKLIIMRLSRIIGVLEWPSIVLGTYGDKAK